MWTDNPKGAAKTRTGVKRVTAGSQHGGVTTEEGKGQQGCGCDNDVPQDGPTHHRLVPHGGQAQGCHCQAAVQGQSS